MTRRQWTTLTFKTTTPVFLGGASGTAGPDRQWISSLRGALRFWYRTIAAGTVGNDPRKLAQAEAALWGTANATAVQSPIRMRLLGGAPAVSRDERPSWLVPAEERNQPKPAWYGEVGYLLGPGLADTRNRRIAPAADRSQRPWVPAGSTVTVGVAFPARDNRPAVRAFTASLAMLTGFGGLGARTSRGWGGLQLVAVDGAPDADVRILERLTGPSWDPTLVHRVLGHDRARGAGPPPFPSSDWLTVAAPSGAFDTWDEALEEAGRRLRAARADDPSQPSPRTKRHTTEYLRAVGGSAPGPFPLAAAGLPTIFKPAPRNPGTKDRGVKLDLIFNGKATRLSSPLIVRVVRVRSGDRPWAIQAALFEMARPPGASLLFTRNLDRFPSVAWGDVSARLGTIFDIVAGTAKPR